VRRDPNRKNADISNARHRREYNVGRRSDGSMPTVSGTIRH
jgi:hypothetical protein